MDTDFFSLDDDKEGATVLDDPKEPGVESRDNAIDNDAWIWKSNSP